jgi:radical SAM superfamily enzyme YgiQ (UPF0313 family)
MTHTTIIFCPFVAISSIPPLAPALLKGCLEDQGISAHTFDFNLDFHQKFHGENAVELVAWMTTPDIKINGDIFCKYQEFISDCTTKVLALNPKVICVSVFSHESQRFAEDLCYHIKTQTHTHIIVGGSGVGIKQHEYGKLWAEVMIDSGLVDSALLGEAESTIADLVRNCVPGIHRSPQLDNEELADVSVPNFDNYNLDAYGVRDQLKLPITATKGCIRSCSFCDVASIWPKFRYRRGENVANEMISLYQRYGIQNFTFTDSLINGGLKPFREMNTLLSQKLPNTISYSGQFICRDQNSMPPEDFTLMKTGGCSFVSIGIESGSEQVRAHMKKGFSNIDIDYVATQLLKNNIKQVWNIIVGYPTETDQDWQDTINLISRYKNFHNEIKIAPVGVFQMLQNTPITSKSMLADLDIELEVLHGYSEYNWVSGLNLTNNLSKRASRWDQLIDIIQEYNMLYTDPNRLKQKSLVLKQQMEYYESKSNRPVFEIHQQSFQEPTNFTN